MATGAGRILTAEGEAHNFGFTLGNGAMDASMGTENAFFLDGKCVKLDLVTAPIVPPPGLQDWHFASNDGSFEMIFQPTQVREEKHRLLLNFFNRRQYIGVCKGKIKTSDARELNFQNITGFAELRRTKG
jgi:hypothetical protein